LHRLWKQLHLLLVWSMLSSVLWVSGAVAAPGAEGQSVRPASVQVQDGDMASVLAFRLKPRGATIEQMMVALLQHNPDAFIQGNVNLLRDGAVLRLPSPEEVQRIPPDEARDTVQRHYRASSGDLEGLTVRATPSRSAETAPGLTTPTSGSEEPTDREALVQRLRTAKARLTELQQNIQELERMTQAVEASEPQAVASKPVSPSDGLPVSWIWLGVAAIVAVMIGVGYSRRASHPTVFAESAPQTHAAAEFQARLGALDLNLDAPSGTTSSIGGQP